MGADANVKERQRSQVPRPDREPRYVVRATASSVLGMVPSLGLERSMEDPWTAPAVLRVLSDVPTVFVAFREHAMGRDEFGQQIDEIESLLLTAEEAEALIAWLTRHCDFLIGLTKELASECPRSNQGESIWWIDYTLSPKEYEELSFDAFGLAYVEKGSLGKKAADESAAS